MRKTRIIRRQRQGIHVTPRKTSSVGWTMTHERAASRAKESSYANTHQTAVVDFNPASGTLAQFFLDPVIRGQYRAFFCAEIRSDAL